MYAFTQFRTLKPYACTFPCAQVLGNAIGLVRLLVAARAPPSSAGLELLLLQRRQLGVNASEQPLRQDQARVRV